MPRTPAPDTSPVWDARIADVSGDVEADCAYLMTLTNIDERRHELWRLGALHGRYYQADIKRRFTELWNQRNVQKQEGGEEGPQGNRPA